MYSSFSLHRSRFESSTYPPDPSSSSSSFSVSRHACSRGWACGVHPSRGWLGLGGGGRRLHLHRLLLRLPQVHHRLLQRYRGHLRRYAESGVLHLIHHAGCHVRRRWVSCCCLFITTAAGEHWHTRSFKHLILIHIPLLILSI